MDSVQRVSSGRPLSAAVKEEIVRLIAADFWPAGSQLPGEPELARKLGVSRVVLREAIRTLEAEGVLVKRSGVGTFVNAPYLLIDSPLSTNCGMTEVIERAGLEAGTASMVITEGVLGAYYAARLDRPSHTRISRIERVRLAAGRPVALTIDYIASDMCRSGFEELADGGSIYELLEKWGMGVRNGYARLIPTKAGERVGRLLGINEESVVLLLEQVDHDDADRVVMFSEEYHVHGAFRFLVRREGREPKTAMSSADDAETRDKDERMFDW
jgi:GntR family transcriptional regulator